MKVSFEELRRQVALYAAAMRKMGVRRGDRVVGGYFWCLSQWGQGSGLEGMRWRRVRLHAHGFACVPVWHKPDEEGRRGIKSLQVRPGQSELGCEGPRLPASMWACPPEPVLTDVYIIINNNFFNELLFFLMKCGP